MGSLGLWLRIVKAGFLIDLKRDQCSPFWDRCSKNPKDFWTEGRKAVDPAGRQKKLCFSISEKQRSS